MPDDSGDTVALGDTQTALMVEDGRSNNGRNHADRIGMASHHRQPLSVQTARVEARSAVSAPITDRRDALLLIAQITTLISTLEAWRTELHLEVQAADEPTDEDWAAYEAMCRDDELHPRRERFADEIEDARDAVEDRAIACWEGA